MPETSSTGIRALFACVGLLGLAACTGLERACEDVEPFRPLIRGAITVATSGATAIPFALTSQVSCADLESLAKGAANRQ